MVAVGPDRVRQRARILGELDRAQHAHVLDPLDRRASPCPALNSWSRSTVKPSLRLSWNQSRQVTRLPDQLWKYSCADHALDRVVVAVGGGLGVGEDVAWC